MMCVTTSCCFINPCLLFFQSKIRRKKSKWSKSEDEGFESPNSPPLSPVDHQPESFPEPQKAPLANEEDLDSVEKYETEVTKEKDGETKKELSVRIFLSFKNSCPYQLGNKCSKETILNSWRNEKYFSISLIYQLFGYN